MRKENGVGMRPDYPGRILGSNCSTELKARIRDCVNGLRRFEQIGNPAIPYVSAWQDEKKEMWYEYLSPRFRGLFQGEDNSFPETFRNSILERRVYKQLRRKRRK